MRAALCEHAENFTLTPEAEQSACLLAHHGCQKSQKALILHLLPFLSQLVTLYRLKEDLRDECWSEASAALIEAVRKYDPHRGFSIKSYVSWFIHAAIRRSIRKQALISIPKNRWYTAQRLTDKNCRSKSRQELPTAFYFEDISRVAEQNFAAQATDSPEQLASRSYLSAVIWEGLDALSSFEKQVICERYGINQENAVSSRELARKLKCSRSAILKAEESAKRSLRILFQKKGLDGFIGGE